MITGGAPSRDGLANRWHEPSSRCAPRRDAGGDNRALCSSGHQPAADLRGVTRWCASEMSECVTAIRWQVVSTNRYSTVLAIRTSRWRVICKISRSVTAASAPLVYASLAGVRSVPELIAATRIGTAQVMLFECVPLRDTPAAGDRIVAALGDAQHAAAGRLAGVTAPLRLELGDLLPAVRSILGARDRGARYSSRLLRWAAASTATLRQFPLDQFWHRWRGALGAWVETLGSAATVSTVDHADLHPGNARISEGGRCVLLDWDDARVGVPFLSLDKLVVAGIATPDSASVRGYVASFGVPARDAREVALAGAGLGPVRDWQRISTTLRRSGRCDQLGSYAKAWAVRADRLWRDLGSS